MDINQMKVKFYQEDGDIEYIDIDKFELMNNDEEFPEDVTFISYKEIEYEYKKMWKVEKYDKLGFLRNKR